MIEHTSGKPLISKPSNPGNPIKFKKKWKHQNNCEVKNIVYLAIIKTNYSLEPKQKYTNESKTVNVGHTHRTTNRNRVKYYASRGRCLDKEAG